jgi:hypothetical protein
MPDEKLTPEVELEKARAERAQEEAKRAASEENLAKMQAETRKLRLRDTYAAEFSKVGLKSFLPEDDVVRLLTSEEGIEVTPSADGTSLHVKVDGRDSTFEAAMEKFATAHRNLFDGRTLRARGLGNESEKIQARSDLTSREEVRAYLTKFGLEAYEKLPSTRPKTTDVSRMTAEDWRRLSISAKTELIKQHGELVVSQVMKRQEKK